MEKREAESEECLLLALLALRLQISSRSHETSRCTSTALYGFYQFGKQLGHNTTDLKCIQQSAHGVHYWVYSEFCLCYTWSCSQANPKAGLGMWLHNLWPRKLSMWDGDYLESVSSSVFRLPSSSWAAPTEFMLLIITASAVKLFNPWINATVSVLGSIVFMQDGASPCLFDHVDWCVCQFWLLHTGSMLLWDR